MREKVQGIKENYDKKDKTRIQDIEKDLGNLTTATQTFQIQRREAEMLSERVAILLSYIQGHSKYIWKTLQFLSDLKHAPESPDQFVQHFHNWFRLREVKS